MASTREDNPYEGGTGGKFRKRPFKRSQATPYDRPPTALRNANRNSWLSKLVDPAQRLITSGAQMFFSRVFRKRLPPPPLLPVQESEKDLTNMDHKAALTDPVRVAGTVHLIDSASDKIDVVGVTELEQILKQKTFTRSEIDHLTSLLHSRTTEVPSSNEEKKLQLPSSALIESHCKEECLKNSAQEDRIRSHAVSRPIVTSSGLEEDVVSPTEIAKAYMESMSSKVSPLMFGSQTPGYRIESTSPSRHPFPSKTPVLSLVPSSLGHAVISENGFMTPRSHGRSAIYTMARTPYSRVHAMKNKASTNDYSAQPSSSSQSAWGQDITLGPKQGVLKRSSSVLDNDIGFVGPIRRIRQKPNLLSSKGLSSPAYGHPTSMTETGVGSEVVHHFQSSNVHPSSYSVRKSLLSGEPINKFLERSKENGDSVLPSTSIPTIPSKSREMASKILEQIDKLTPPKDKSSELKVFGPRDKVPTKLSTSMLRGQALRSLEEVDSSKYLENIQDNKWSNSSFEILAPGTQNFYSRNQDKVEQNGTVKSVGDESTIGYNGLGYDALSKDATPNLIKSVSSVVNSVCHPPQKKRAFQMSAHEDYLDFDDEGYSNGPTTDSLAEDDKKMDGSLTNKKVFAETTIAKKPPDPSKVTSAFFPATDWKSDVKLSDDSVASGPISSLIFPTAHSVPAENPIFSFQQPVSQKELSVSGPVFSFGNKLFPQKEVTAAPVFLFADKVTLLEEQKTPILTFEDNVVASTQTNTVSPVFNFGEKLDSSMDRKVTSENGEKFSLSKFSFASSLAGESDGLKAGASSSSNAEGPDNSLVAVSTSNFDGKESVSDKADDKINSKVGSALWTSGNAMSSASTAANISSIFSFSSAGGDSNLINGSFTPSTSDSPSPIPPLVFSNNKVTPQSDNPSLTIASNSSETVNTSSTTVAATLTSINPNISFSTSSLPSSSPAAPTFKFGGSAPAVSAITGTDSVDAKSKQEISLGKTSNIPLSGSSASVLSNGSSTFGFNEGAASTGNKELKAPGIGSGSIFGSSMPVSGTGVAASTLSIPLQFGSSSASLSFGLSGNHSSSGNSMFGSTTSTAQLFNSSPKFGLVSSTSSNEAITLGLSSGSGTNSLVFGASWEPAKSLVFGSTFPSAPQTGFSFGSSTSGASMAFGSSTGAATSLAFSFSSPAALTSSQPVFGNPTTAAFAFGSTSPGMSDQMNMEDSMAEDTVHTVMQSFGEQQPLSPSPSRFVFGSTPSAGNPFQFGGQQNPGTPQNSPFQASASVDFNGSGGGSFSLGSAGGGDKANRKFVKVKHKQRKK